MYEFDNLKAFHVICRFVLYRMFNDTAEPKEFKGTDSVINFE